MLRFFVFGDMFQQILLMREAFVAGVTFEGFIGLVAATVALEIRELRESLGAADLGASVGLISRVRTNVLLQVRELRKLPLADFASVRLNS